MVVGDGSGLWLAAKGSWRRLMKAVASGWAPVGGGVPLSSLAVADPELVVVTPPRGCCCSNGGRVLGRVKVDGDGGARG
ncbi:hypothetical protein Dimus_030898, partial [Dionaea muscipula]